ncbi:MAG: UdgX family uracil-DNA binding protein [Sphingobium sp.]
MTARFPPPLHGVTLTAQDDFGEWRSAARVLLAAAIPPDRVVWSVAGEAPADLFAEAAPLPPGAGSDPGLRLSRDLLALLRTALLNRDPGRFALAYRILWRLRSDPSLPGDPSDPDMIALGALAKAVRRDLHKMHAFVRFRKIGGTDGRERFAAWFEPDHHIGRAVAGFFRGRFAGMDWLIVMPEVSIAWDGATLREGPGGTRADVPSGDAVEAEWRAYYASIFNPARVKVAAMKKEMPVRYWRNLPEAALISGLVTEAERRVDAMVKERKRAPDLFAGDMADAQDAAQRQERHFASLSALNEALRREDVPPSPHFSDHVVPGEGPAHASLMLVGEQPGDQEDRQGRPFVGPAGQLLDQCLEEAGLDRAQAYLTNAVKRFKFMPRGKRRLHSTPTAGDITHYRWWLKEEIRLVDPAIVVALGSTALQALSGRKQALGPLRGSLEEWGGRRILVTVHPSFLLRLPDEQARLIERARFVRDLAGAVRKI